MENILLQYAPTIIVVFLFLVQHRLVVRPEELEKKHREILLEAETRFASIQSFKDLKEQFFEMKEKIDKIYDCVINKK